MSDQESDTSEPDPPARLEPIIADDGRSRWPLSYHELYDYTDPPELRDGKLTLMPPRCPPALCCRTCAQRSELLALFPAPPEVDHELGP